MCYAADELARELPPRARRIPTDSIHHHIVRGTTSACAENTGQKETERTPSWNYLRVRGEYKHLGMLVQVLVELPPRARRIQIKIDVNKPLEGTTSACAENTFPPSLRKCFPWNYLRVRGEYRSWPPRGPEQMELPPRARRIRSFSSRLNST